MESGNIFKKVLIKMFHLPTIMLVIGYVVYWVELYFLKASDGVTSLLAPILFVLVSIFTIFFRQKNIIADISDLKSDFIKLKLASRIFIIFGFLGISFILGCSLWASLMPPHLVQEFDALNYHYTLPRQHLILNSFQHIKWSSADLFLMPVQFALAPYWFVTQLPNKIPQFIFLLGLIGIGSSLVKIFSKGRPLAVILFIFTVLGSHIVGIQAGTAMLDLSLCYLFLAALDSFISGNFAMALIEFTFFFWSKPLVPLQVLTIFLFIIIIWFILCKLKKMPVSLTFTGYSMGFKRKVSFKKTIIWFIMLSLLIGGPFVFKSIYYAGTPLFPLGAGGISFSGITSYSQDDLHYLQNSSKGYGKVKNNYGYGRSFVSFLKHFWLIAVPDKGVNNKFDYPVGLPYLLLIAPFFTFLVDSLRKKIFAFLPLLVLISWGLWWFGPQQARFLYVPILLIYVLVLSAMDNPSGVLIGLLVLALFINSISVFRAYKPSFRLRRQDVLREKDKILLGMNAKYLKSEGSKHVVLDFHDVAFARFPVLVKEQNSIWVLPCGQ